MKRQRIGPKQKIQAGLTLILFALALAFLVSISNQVQPVRAQDTAPGTASEQPEYTGSDVCMGCHKAYYDTWKFTAHRQTSISKDRPETERGCEGCHGPGGRHVSEGGGKGTMFKFGSARSEDITKVCLRCHPQPEVTMWPTSVHARSKLSCVTCHSGHLPTREQLLKDIDAKRNTLEGYTARLKDLDLAVKSATPGSEEHQKALAELEKLQAEKETVKEELNVTEGRYRRNSEPDQCIGCHRKLKVQINLQSRHPLLEGKMMCSDCHNPHGGPNNMLREERTSELCYKCHGQYEGPYVFEHPPVTEDCTVCHQPHGSPHNNLLIQTEPFLCLKCHAGPHSRSQTFANPLTIAQYYNRCTGCHNQIHGSDRHPPLHY